MRTTMKECGQWLLYTDWESSMIGTTRRGCSFFCCSSSLASSLFSSRELFCSMLSKNVNSFVDLEFITKHLLIFAHPQRCAIRTWVFRTSRDSRMCKISALSISKIIPVILPANSGCSWWIKGYKRSPNICFCCLGVAFAKVVGVNGRTSGTTVWRGGGTGIFRNVKKQEWWSLSKFVRSAVLLHYWNFELYGYTGMRRAEAFEVEQYWQVLWQLDTWLFD